MSDKEEKPTPPARTVTNETSYEIRGSREIPTNNDRPKPTERK